MTTKIICRTVDKGRQAFYLEVDGARYFLFEQDYRVSCRDFFKNGYTFYDKIRYDAAHSASVKRTLAKIIPHVEYVEKEYGISVLKKTKKKNVRILKRRFDHNDLWEEYA